MPDTSVSFLIEFELGAPKAIDPVFQFLGRAQLAAVCAERIVWAAKCGSWPEGGAIYAVGDLIPVVHKLSLSAKTLNERCKHRFEHCSAELSSIGVET